MDLFCLTYLVSGRDFFLRLDVRVVVGQGEESIVIQQIVAHILELIRIALREVATLDLVDHLRILIFYYYYSIQ